MVEAKNIASHAATIQAAYTSMIGYEIGSVFPFNGINFFHCLAGGLTWMTVNLTNDTKWLELINSNFGILCHRV